MRRISNYKEFLSGFRKVREQSRLFLFILFDERPTQRAVAKFVDEGFDWLDSLAAAAEIFGFAFLRRDRSSGEIFNPSLKVARLFGIQANQLPGVLLFTMLKETEVVNKGIYLPLKADLFKQEAKVIEGVFADLFSLIQKAQDETSTQEKLIRRLRRDVASLSRRQKVRPIIKFLGKRIEGLKSLPVKLLESMAGSFGEGFGKRF